MTPKWKHLFMLTASSGLAVLALLTLSTWFAPAAQNPLSPHLPLALADTGPAALPQQAPITVGEVENSPTEIRYADRANWQQVVAYPGAAFIKVHFQEMKLLPGDYVTVASLNGDERYTYPNESPFTTDDEPGFWAMSVTGDTAVITLHRENDQPLSSNLEAALGLVIDKFTRGYPAAEIEDRIRAAESTCGNLERQDVACYESSNPTEFNTAGAVARMLLNNGTSLCTGWRVGSADHMMTNEHCITDQAGVDAAEAWFNYQRAICGGAEPDPAAITKVTGNTLLVDNFDLDFALFTINSAATVAGFGFLELDVRTPVLGEEIYIPQHGSGNPKEFGIEDDQNTDTSLCRIDVATTTGRIAGSDTGYFCDTIGGSSGSPVLARSSHKVIALHHFGGNCVLPTVNRGVMIEQIWPEIEPFLTSTISLRSDSYEPDNEPADAKFITSGSPQNHSISPVSDVDWVKFSLRTEAGIIIETRGITGDTVMELYSSTDLTNTLETDDDSGTSTFSLIDRECGVDALPAGTYFAKITDKNDDDVITSYDIGFSQQSCLDAALVVESIIIDDSSEIDGPGNSSGDGDGIAECGETVEIFVNLQNNGSNSANGVQGFIGTSDPYASIFLNSYSNYPEMPGGSIAAQEDDFDLVIADVTPFSHTIQLAYDVFAAEGGPWFFNLEIPVSCETQLDTSISYQGQLVDDTGPVNDTCEMNFDLFATKTMTDTQIGSTQAISQVVVEDGLFLVVLDFGPDAFIGDTRWLETSVKCGDDADFTLLEPRQPLAPAPHAMYARNIPLAGNGLSTRAARSDHNHLGQQWNGNNDPLIIDGTFGVAPLVLNNQAADALRVNFGGTDGFQVSEAVYDGVQVDIAGDNGVEVFYAGADGVNVFSAGDDGLEVGYAAGDGVYVYEAGFDGMYVYTTTYDGFNVANAGDDGFQVLNSSYGLYASNVERDGVLIGTTGDDGVQVFSAGGNGIEINTAGLYGVYIANAAQDGVWVNQAADDGFYVTNAGGDGVYVDTAGNFGAYVGTTTNDGIQIASAGDDGLHILGTGTNSADGDGVIVSSAARYGFYAFNTGADAARFVGDVSITGNLSKGGGSFKIDHPLDPENQYLSHSFVESPDMMNVYNGNAVLDENGETWVELPDYFEALNRDIRYQLTPIGAPGPNLYIASEVSDNRFRIAGGEPGSKVSWQVTGIRQDPYAEQNPIIVEEQKPADERGTYLHPDAYGQPEERGLDHQLQQEDEKPLPETNENQTQESDPETEKLQESVREAEEAPALPSDLDETGPSLPSPDAN